MSPTTRPAHPGSDVGKKARLFGGITAVSLAGGLACAAYKAVAKGSTQTKELAVARLDEENLRERFTDLAPAFRLTRAGAGRPRGVSDEDLSVLMSLSLVKCVKEPHVAAGMLDVYRLTALGEKTYQDVAKGNGRPRRRLTALLQIKT